MSTNNKLVIGNANNSNKTGNLSRSATINIQSGVSQVIDKEVENIKSAIEESLKEIDSRFWSDSFNIMNELINVFGESNYEKVKYEMNKFDKLDLKLDSVLRVLVNRHSSEFFKILAFVRQVSKDNELFSSRLNEANDLLNGIRESTQLLSQGSTQEWKLRSMYFTEILLRLNKVLTILKIIKDTEEFLETDKLFEAVYLISKTIQEHNNFDKEFRKFDLLVSINERFIKIKGKISEKLLKLIDVIIFFSKENCIEAKVDSCVKLFINTYKNIPVDTELYAPFLKHLFVLRSVCFDLLDKSLSEVIEKEEDYVDKELGGKLSNREDKPNLHYQMMEFESDHKSQSLVYLIRSLKMFEDFQEVLVILKERFEEKMIQLLEKLTKSIQENFRLGSRAFSIYESQVKINKIKTIVFFQSILSIYYHTSIKIAGIMKYFKKENSRFLLSSCLAILEQFILLPLVAYLNIVIADSSVLNSAESTRKQSQQLDQEQSKVDLLVNSLKIRVSETLTCSIDFLPIILKIYSNFVAFNSKTAFPHSYTNLTANLHCFNDLFFQTLLDKFSVKKMIDSTLVLNEYDTELHNFKFINEILNKIGRLRELLVYGIDSSFIHIIRTILKGIYQFSNEYREFLKSQRAKACYNEVFESIAQLFITASNEPNDSRLRGGTESLGVELKHNFYQQNLEEKDSSPKKKIFQTTINIKSSEQEPKSSLYTSFKNTNLAPKDKPIEEKQKVYSGDNLNFVSQQYAGYIKLMTRLIFNHSRSDSESLNLVTKSFTFTENFLKLISSVENVITVYDSFLHYTLEKCLTQTNIKAIIQQYSTPSYKQILKDMKSQILDSKSKSTISDDGNSKLVLSAENDLEMLIGLCLYQLDELNSLLIQNIVQSKVELSCLFISLFRSVSRTSYWLSEPQMNPDYFINNFNNETTKYLQLYQQTLPDKIFDFCVNNQEHLLNYMFNVQLSSLNQNSINILGVNLLLRNYDKVFLSIFKSHSFTSSFKERIEYFPNYVKLLTLNEETLLKKLKEYFVVSTFSQQFIDPILSLKTNMNRKFSEEDKNSFFNYILKS